MLKPISECTTVAELLADKSRWMQAQMTNSQDPSEQTCFCLRGAIDRICFGDALGWKASEQLKHSAMIRRMETVINVYSIINFNDTHTYEEVYAKVLEAGI